MTAVVHRYMEALESLVLRSGLIDEAVDGADWDGLLYRLDERQSLIDEIDGMAVDYRALSQKERARAGRMLTYLREQDARVNGRMLEAAAATRSSLEDSIRARTTATAYRRTGNVRPEDVSRFVDKQR